VPRERLMRYRLGRDWPLKGHSPDPWSYKRVETSSDEIDVSIVP
jgi:hypothetical protein